MDGERTISLDHPATVTLTLAQWNQVIAAIVQTHPLIQAINAQLSVEMERAATSVGNVVKMAGERTDAQDTRQGG